MRIGFFTEVYRPIVNGVVESVDGLAAGLGARGHEVYCFAPRMPGGDAGDERVVRFPSLPLPSTPYRLILPLVSRRNVRNVIRRLRIIHVHSLFVTGWTGLRYARRYGMPIVFTYHTQLEAYAHYVPFEPNATRFAATQLTRTFGNLVDAVVAPTPAIARRLRALGIERRIDVVPSGIDVARFSAGRRDPELRRRLGVRDADRLALFVSRLAREKNADIILQALATVNDPSLHLAIAGDGPARADLELLARDLRITERVRFLGTVPRERLPDLYASADAFVFPSTTETQGLVLAEALAAGAFVIAADAEPNREVLAGAGRIVAANPRAFAAALRDVPCVPNDVSQAGSRAAAARFSIAAQAGRMEELYGALLDVANVCSL
jgi:glycosyltransferase involved in cell wall biosynthesis